MIYFVNSEEYPAFIGRFHILVRLLKSRSQNCPLILFNLGNQVVVIFFYLSPQYISYYLTIFTLIVCFCFIISLTDPDAVTALKALKDIWKNVPPTWVGADPCGSRWEGILCANSRVTSM